MFLPRLGHFRAVLGHRAFAALLDQGAVSIASFGTGILLSRAFAGPERGQLGLYYLAVAIGILIMEVQNALVSTPHMVTAPTLKPDLLRGFNGRRADTSCGAVGAHHGGAGGFCGGCAGDGVGFASADADRVRGDGGGAGGAEFWAVFEFCAASAAGGVRGGLGRYDLAIGGDRDSGQDAFAVGVVGGGGDWGGESGGWGAGAVFNARASAQWIRRGRGGIFGITGG